MPTELSTDVLQPIGACVVVPTYNNGKTLGRVLDGLAAITRHIIVVNDGSTDNTTQVLTQYPTMRIIHLARNSGKGFALQTGFSEATKCGYRYAVTIDSDGQHYPDDLPVFVDEVQHNGEGLLIGARNMAQEGVPEKSSFGNRFSNFWFWFETGIRLQDTQCGYRLYPLKPLQNIKFYTHKFEFEIEVIVKAAWRGVPIRNVPVKVLYDPDERVSHFRPFHDFARISVLNTWLVFVSLVYIRPRNHFRALKKKGIKQFFFDDFLQSNDSPAKKSLSVSLGILIGMSPLWGFHTITVLFLAYLLRLNKLIAFACSNISIPPMIPIIIYGGLKVGSVLLGSPLTIPPRSGDAMAYWLYAKNHITQYLVGSTVLAISSSILIGLVAYGLLSLWGSKRTK